MENNPILTLIENQSSLGPIEDSIQTAVKDAYDSAGEAGELLKQTLGGDKWLGHPLHPVVTDVPIGSWTATAVLYALEVQSGSKYAAGADVSLMVGLAGAVLAAASGITDWSETEKEARRVGLVHGIINTETACLYTGSLIARKSGNRPLGRKLSFAGLVTLAAGAYLGGELTYTQRVGVKPEKMPAAL